MAKNKNSVCIIILSMDLTKITVNVLYTLHFMISRTIRVPKGYQS